MVFEDARDVGMEFATFCVAQERAATFRAEHEGTTMLASDWDMVISPFQGLVVL